MGRPKKAKEIIETPKEDTSEEITEDIWDDEEDGGDEEEDSEEVSAIEKVKENNLSISSQERKWAATESAVVFHLCNLVKKLKKELKSKYPGANFTQINKLIGASLKLFKLNDQKFTYTTKPNSLGGVRWFIECPKCKAPCLKLYLPRTPSREPLYLCASCHKLKPTSMLIGNTKKYKKVTKHLKRLEMLDKRLLKKRLTAKEAEKLLEEHEELEKILADSVEYRLYLFRKEHGKS